MPARLDTTVTLGDGRRPAYTEWGTAAGSPILYFHGTPGSRTWCPDEAATIEANVRLIVPDRPGIGRSDPKERRTFGDWPADVVELADLLGITMFAVIVAWELNTAYLPWGFRLANIPIQVGIWHGSQDTHVNEADIEFQVSTIPRCSLTVWRDSGHLGFAKH